MTTLTVYAGSGDGYIENGSTTWSVAQEGPADSVSTSGASASQIGPSSYYKEIRTAYFPFDTSSLGAVNILNAAFSLYITSLGSYASESGYFELRAAAVTSTLDVSEWIDDEGWAAATLCARIAMTDMTYAARNDFVSQSGFPSAINRTGTTWVALQHEQFTGTSWVGRDITIAMAEDGSGTTNDPRLIVTYEPSGNAIVQGTNM